MHGVKAFLLGDCILVKRCKRLLHSGCHVKGLLMHVRIVDVSKDLAGFLAKTPCG